jgi:transcriptional regulator with XRE-family HTH domain
VNHDASQNSRDGCPSTTRHDTLAAFDWPGCRCPKARAANGKRQKTYQVERVRGYYRMTEVTGSARRIQALIALGWTQQQIAARLGITVQRLNHLHLRQKFIYRTTAERIRVLYDELSTQPGPSNYARTAAARLGYPPPLAWDDETIDDPAAKPADWRRTDKPGGKVPLDDITHLASYGLSDEQIAARFGVTAGAITRRRNAA